MRGWVRLMIPLLRALALALGLALACASGMAEAQGYSAAARRVLNQARAATGGAGWNMLRGWHETGSQGGVRYETWLDPVRYGLRVETHDPAGRRIQGFNGAGEWRILPSGWATGAADPATLAQVRTAAFFGGNFFFYPGRYDARGAYVGVRQIGERAFEVVNIQPWGGSPRELWFDRRTHLLSRIVDRTGPRPVTVELSDYRRVGPVLVAFRHAVEDGGSGSARARQVESLAFTPVDRAIFSLPRPNASSPTVQQDAAAFVPPRPSRDERDRLEALELPRGR